MCGIIGYIGSKNSVPILLSGLKRLEYRGYDSVGISVLSDKIKTIKQKGKISEFKPEEISGNIGIAHTRWATHGEPNEINAHPHSNSSGTISIVHNGIIENYVSLKKFLQNKGHKFKSDTDSEVIAHLIEEFYEGDLNYAVRYALKNIEGTYGLAVICEDEKKLIGARNGSPLILGIGDNEFFLSSDISGIAEHTKNIIYLKDKQIVDLNRDGYKITDMENKQADYTIEEITWDIKNIEKEGYKHFMLKEIYEQPQVLKNAMRGRIKDDTIKLTLNLDDVFLKNLNRIIITACGTSWHAALIGKYLIEKHSKIPVEIDYASEFRYRDPIVTEKDLVIVISQSGETADTLSALREAKKKGAKTLGIVNVVGSTITREVDGGIYTHAGFEIGVASTKAFSTQIMALNLFNLLLTKLKNGKTNEFLTGELEKIPALVEKILDTEKIINIAEKYFNSTNFLYLGRGINFPTALEGALKLKEISYIHAEGYPAAEMKHGPIALIDKDMPVVFIANKGNAYKKIISNMEEVLSRKGRVIAIATEGDNEIADRIEDVIYVPDVIEELTPFLNVVPLQLLSYYIADLRSCEIDQPRNLAKSVTVE